MDLQYRVDKRWQGHVKVDSRQSSGLGWGWHQLGTMKNDVGELRAENPVSFLPAPAENQAL